MVVDLFDLNIVVVYVSSNIVVDVNEIFLFTANMTDRYAVIPKNQAKYIPNFNGETVAEEFYPAILLNDSDLSIEKVEELFSNIDLSTMTISLRNESSDIPYFYGFVSACKITVDIREETLLYIKLKYPHLIRNIINEYG